MRIAAFARYDREAASTRQRMLQYFPALNDAGFEVDYHPLLGNEYVRSLATGRNFPWHRVAGSYAKRLWQLIAGERCDIIWVYSELFPKLPAWFEQLAFRRGKPVVYDFDDAFFTSYDDHPSSVVRTILAGKLEPLISGASAVCCGNDHLLSYASRFNDHAILLPTVVDTEVYTPAPVRPPSNLTIGWIGSPSTWANVRPLLPMLKDICRDHGAVFHVVGAGTGAEADRFAGMKLVNWTEEAEVSELHQMDIGVMPLLDLPFHRGKSGYKLVQYMACGLPVVASPVGVNKKIVEPGVNGFLASTPDEWDSSLRMLIGDPSLRTVMGNAGRRKAVSAYSLASQSPRLVGLFQSLARDQ